MQHGWQDVHFLNLKYIDAVISLSHLGNNTKQHFVYTEEQVCEISQKAVAVSLTNVVVAVCLVTPACSCPPRPLFGDADLAKSLIECFWSTVLA